MRGVLKKGTILAVLTVLGAASLPQGRVTAQVGPSRKMAGGPAIRDNARMFSTGALSEATRVLDEIQNAAPHHWQVVVETVDSLGGKDPLELASSIGKGSNVKGLIVLISKGDHKAWVEPSTSSEGVFSKDFRAGVLNLITSHFKAQEFDKGLLDAVAEIRRKVLGFGVLDRAGIFKPETVVKADASLDAIHSKTKWNAVIETVETLGGKDRLQLALENAKALEVHGIYILIAKKEKKLAAQRSETAKAVFTGERVRALEDALTSAFKIGDFDKGLLDAVAAIRNATESDSSSVATSTVPTNTTSPKVDVPVKEPKLYLPGPGDAPAKPSARSTFGLPPESSSPPVTKIAADVKSPIGLPGPASTPEPLPQTKEGSSMIPFLLIVGGGTLLFLWVVSRMFRRSPQIDRSNMMANPGAGYPQQLQPQNRAGVPPGYDPQQRPGPGQAPGYGYGQPQAPPPGYGYGAPPPQQGGGGFMSGALGGLGGAIVGNILYDKFGRAIPQEGSSHPHEHHGQVDPQGNSWPQNQAPAPTQPSETYDPNAGVGGDWGTPDAPVADDGAGGDWGNAAPVDQGGGDWGSPDNSAPDTGGGDWGGGPEPQPEPEPDAGGDWGGGGGDAGGGDDQGGSW